MFREGSRSVRGGPPLATSTAAVVDQVVGLKRDAFALTVCDIFGTHATVAERLCRRRDCVAHKARIVLPKGTVSPVLRFFVCRTIGMGGTRRVTRLGDFTC